MTSDQARFSQASTEAANRAEATALLIRCGYRVYRPEADIEGEDLVLRTPSSKEVQGELLGVQLKPRIYVDRLRYGGLQLRMLFPIGPFTPEKPRSWYLVPHDPLFVEVEARHGHTPGWTGRWHSAKPSAALRDFLAAYQIKPPAERDLETGDSRSD